MPALVAIMIIVSIGTFFAWKVAQIVRVSSSMEGESGTRTYVIDGQLFFATADQSADSFDFREGVGQVRIELAYAHIRDLTGENASTWVVLKFRKEDV